MSRTIVVGVDGRPGGRDALALARLLAAPGEARFVLVHAFPYDPTFPRGRNDAFEQALAEDARGILERERAAAGIDADLVAIADVHAARALHGVAEERAADLIAVGSSHRGPVGRLLLGDVARGTLHGAPCPVAVAPRDHAAREAEVRFVGVGFDGSPEAQHALDAAAALARRTGAVVEVVGVVTEPEAFTPAYAMTLDWSDVIGERRRRLDAAIAAAVERLDVEAAGRTIVGAPVRALADRTEEVDVLFVGSRSFGPVRRVLLGSTSDQLVEHAHCPVVVVPRGAGEEAPAGAATPAAPAGR
jgi:nucleotide-binding universal stress UspA family protein